MDPILKIVIAGVVLIALSWIVNNARKARLYTQLKPKLDRLELDERLQAVEEAWKVKEDLEAREKNLREIGILVQEKSDALKKSREAFDILDQQRSAGFPWLAEAYADYYYLQDLQIADQLAAKSPPARKTADLVREIAAERRKAERLWRILSYQLEYYESLFPELSELKGEDVDELITQTTTGSAQLDETDEADDPARRWLTQAEYDALTTAGKYQRALDKYWSSRKSKWELGRDYERYVGYHLEVRGHQVTYQGILRGFADLGRDLIAISGDEVLIVQCKYWSQGKQIHEKHVLQLFGTLTAYRLEHPSQKASALLITSTVLSDQAKRFAEMLEVRVFEQLPLLPYPCIKCNVSRKDGSRIYHLPFDQQYDDTIVEPQRGERYVQTVAEAEALGFRHAFRWQGPEKTKAEPSSNL